MKLEQLTPEQQEIVKNSLTQKRHALEAMRLLGEWGYTFDQYFWMLDELIQPIRAERDKKS